MEVENGKCLVLTRLPGERIVVGDPMKPIGIIQVVGMSGKGRARLACTFTEDIPVNREEVVRSIIKYADVISEKSSSNPSSGTDQP
jgi:sRNA-binding carbon storage regulator CsrA